MLSFKRQKAALHDFSPFWNLLFVLRDSYDVFEIWHSCLVVGIAKCFIYLKYLARNIMRPNTWYSSDARLQKQHEEMKHPNKLDKAPIQSNRCLVWAVAHSFPPIPWVKKYIKRESEAIQQQNFWEVIKINWAFIARQRQ